MQRRKPRYHVTDTSFVKNIYGRDMVGRNPTDRGRNATKISIVTDGFGIPFIIRLLFVQLAFSMITCDRVSKFPTRLLASLSTVDFCV